MKRDNDIPSSFRDPDGFLFYRENSIYRQINNSYKDNYDFLITSGLYDRLIRESLLISHEELDLEAEDSNRVYRVIKPEPIPFISYPYEWCFSQLKDAALVTLRIQKIAIGYGMFLKDASSYNIQFAKGKPVFIDTLSFEKYKEGRPWPAYRQFCQHFFAPLSLMSCKDARLNQLLKIYVDGIPLDLASALLPFPARFNLSLFYHVYMHAKSQLYFSGKSVDTANFKLSKTALLGLINSLESGIEKLKYKSQGRRPWSDYYANTNYSEKGLSHKKQLVSEFLDIASPKITWDLGANTGLFSRISGGKGTGIDGTGSGYSQI